MGQEEVSRFTCTVNKKALLCMGLAVESHWLALGLPFLSFFCIKSLRNQPSHFVGPTSPAFKASFIVDHAGNA